EYAVRHHRVHRKRFACRLVIQRTLMAGCRGARGQRRQTRPRQRMDRQTCNRLLKRGARVRDEAAPKFEGADRVPSVRATLARVQMTARLVRQLALELLERSRLVSAREADQSEQPVQGDAAEARGTAGLRTLAGNAQ